jgi:hypothetical protein
MITAPSTAFTTAASADFRRPKVSLEVLYTDPFVQSGITVTSDYVNNFGDLDTSIVDDFLSQTADTMVTTPHRYIVNDGSFRTDGTWYAMPSEIAQVAFNQVGWYTSGVADGDGNFATPQEIVITFAEVRAIKTLTVYGKNKVTDPDEYTIDENEYPTDFDVFIYDSSNNILNPVTNFEGTQVSTTLDFTSDDIVTAKYVKLVLNSWSRINTIGKITEFFGVLTDTFTGSNIVSIDVLEEIESDAGSPFGVMSCNELTVELQNISVTKDSILYKDPFLPENTDSYLNGSMTQNARFSPSLGFKLQSGTTELVPMGVFWTTEWNASQTESTATIIARDRLEILRNNVFKQVEVLVGYTLKELAEYIFLDAKINIPLNDLEWSISEELDNVNYTVAYTWFGEISYFEAIYKICQACLGRAYSNRYGVIILETYASDESSSPVFTINQFFKQSRSMQQLKNYIEVPVTPLLLSEEATDIYTSELISVTPGDTTIERTVTWDDDAVLEHEIAFPIMVGVTMDLTHYEYTPSSAILTFTKTSGTEGTFKFKISGKTLYQDSSIEPIIAQNTESISKYNKQIHKVSENFLISTQNQATDIANSMLTFLSNPRRDIVTTVQGNPCTEIGDIASINVYNKSGKYETCRTVRQQFKVDDSGLTCSITSKKTLYLEE